MPVEKCTTPEELQAHYDAVSQKGGHALCIFLYGDDSNPKCEAAKPHIMKTMQANQGANPECTVMACLIKNASDWEGVSDHPWRTSPIFHVTDLPTMILFKGTEEVARASEQAQFEDEEFMTKFSAL